MLKDVWVDLGYRVRDVPEGASLFSCRAAETDGRRGFYLAFLRVYWHSLFGRPSGGVVFLFCVFMGIVFSIGPRGRHLFVARRKIGEKRRASSSQTLTSFVLPLVAKAESFRCSSSPHQTHFVGLWRGPYWRPPFRIPGVMFWATLTCCVRTAFPQGDFLRARNGAFDAIKSAAVPRSKYPWGALRLSPCLCVLRVRLNA